MKKLRLVFVILILIQAAQLISQDKWIQQSSDASAQLDSLSAGLTYLRKQIFARTLDADENFIVDNGAMIQNYGREINTVIDSCNKIFFPVNQAGNNTSALLQVKVNAASSDFRMCKLELMAANDRLQKRAASELCKELLQGLVKFVISTYIPVFK